MTTFEYFKAQYDKNHDYMVQGMKSDIEVDSFRFVQIASKYCFGGTSDVDAWFNINGVTDTKEMRELGYVKVWDGRNCGRPTRNVALTAKGLKAFYKAMF